MEMPFGVERICGGFVAGVGRANAWVALGVPRTTVVGGRSLMALLAWYRRWRGKFAKEFQFMGIKRSVCACSTNGVWRCNGKFPRMFTPVCLLGT